MKKIIPQHIGIILDGNRRWAKKKKLNTFEGHKTGFENLKEISNHIFNKRIKILTVFAFSTENWKRPIKEKNYLFSLLENYFDNDTLRFAETITLFFSPLYGIDPCFKK